MSKIKMYLLKILCIQIAGNEKMITSKFVKMKKEHFNKNTLFFIWKYVLLRFCFLIG